VRERRRDERVEPPLLHVQRHRQRRQQVAAVRGDDGAAEQLARRPVEHDLDEAVLVAGRARLAELAQVLAVGDHVVPARPRLLLGQADRGHLGVGEGHAGHRVIAEGVRRAVEGVLDGERALVGRDVRVLVVQVVAADRVADRPDARRRRP
jgi:hypothetical protein